MDIRKQERIQEIYNRNSDMVYRICYLYLKNEQDAYDVTHETFIRLILRSQGGVQPPGGGSEPGGKSCLQCPDPTYTDFLVYKDKIYYMDHEEMDLCLRRRGMDGNDDEKVAVLDASEIGGGCGFTGIMHSSWQLRM